MYRNRFLALAAVVTAVGLVAGPADARKDSRAGNPFHTHYTDIIAYPHRAVEHNQNASLAFIPQSLSTSRGTPSENQILGLGSIGQNNWSLILGANDHRGYNPTRFVGGHDAVLMPFLMGNPGAEYQIFDVPGANAGDAPKTRMQVGLAYGLESADIGFFFTNASNKDTFETSSPGNPTTEDGWETSYNAFTVSAGISSIEALQSLELSASFVTGSGEILGDPDDPGAGENKNSGFAVNALTTFDSEVLGFTPAANFTFSSGSAEWTPNVTGTATVPEMSSTGINLTVGGIKRWSNGSVFSPYFGLRTESMDFESNADDRVDSEESYFVFPVCGFSSEFWVRDWLGFDCGGFAAYSMETDESTSFTGGSETGSGKGESTDFATYLAAGPVVRVDKGDLQIDIWGKLDLGQAAGNPGGIFFGGDGDQNDFFLTVGMDVSH